MWRLWTRGWGVRDWWAWVRTEGFPMWVVRHLPPRMVYFAFIRVCALTGANPRDLTFDGACQAWEAKYRLRS
jgi:hypothetical protein